MWRVVRKRSIDQMITRSFDQGEKADGQNNVTQGIWITVTPFALQPNCVGDGAIYSRVPNCCERKWGGWQSRTDHGDLTVELTADTLRLQTNHVRTKKEFWYRKRVPESADGEFSWRKRITTDGKGICRSSWRKCVRCPRRLRVPSLNKTAPTAVRPSPLWEFRAANCFRDLIAKLQNENPRRTAVV